MKVFLWVFRAADLLSTSEHPHRNHYTTQGGRKTFYGGTELKCRPPWKISKLHWLKRPKTVSKKRTKFGPENKWFKTSYLEFGVQLLVSDFLAESLKASKNKQKNHSFYNTVSLKIRTHFTKLNSLNIIKNMLLQRSQKPYSLYDLLKFTQFPSKHVSGLCQKSFCTASFLDTQKLHSGSTGKANACIFLYISVRNFFRLRRLVVWAS